MPNVPNPGSDGGVFEITIVQSWSQETNYNRVTQVALGSGYLEHLMGLLAACGYKVLHLPADNQPEDSPVNYRQSQTLDLDSGASAPNHCWSKSPHGRRLPR